MHRHLENMKEDMNTKLHRILTLTLASTFSLGASHALAQSQPAKALAAKTSAKDVKALPSTDEGKRRGKGDRIMTRDELRACMTLKDSNERNTVELERRRAAMDKERAELANAPDSGAAIRAAVDEKLKAVQQADAAFGEHAKAIEDWNERMADFEKRAKDMRNADRRRQVLKQEQFALKVNGEKLQAERDAKVAAYEASVKEANEKINQGGERNNDWNKRNDQLTGDEQDLLDARRKWASECADRRFREEDEIAIKARK